MSEKNMTFIDKSLRGLVMLDDIDDYVEAWHDGASDLELPEYLGMSAEEYELWIHDADSLPYIITARRNHRDLAEVINDSLQDFRLAARSDDNKKITHLKQWLKNKGKLD